MKNNKIRLTEAQINAIVKHSIRRIISENEEDEWGNFFTQDGRNDWKNLGKSFSAGAKAGAASMRGNYQAGQDPTNLYGAESNVNAEQRLRDIDNACRELRTQYTQLLAKRKELETYCQKRGIATLTRKPFQRNKTNALPQTNPNIGRFGSRGYNQASGNIGDLTTQGVGRGA